ncbi:hypothetical protein SARC_02027 [Sphaeroforma arctica JP610]|uniref:LicD/FKTN/FKRP nucleotidyltransferase domain-containing protein n=1 Tax=Sphaeroforma arctica JP610 TaxID=667725 RepID=A0A0L0G9U5_9EUKA|nr:hypothetical protein SARC_02027 [Sphaeroforma arctica JP610]KNC85802.1 hypothetical protein SARC_02027 [Sphaeroforma arctica JP610]|eukprot:XP_014159704.1 hypothetical protein SARC_02027 [Sphaeroforma arctica JP610]
MPPLQKSAKAADDATRLITDIFAINSHSNTTNDRTIESFFQSMSVPETELDTRRVCESAARHFAQVSYFPVHSDELTLMTTDEAFAHTCLLHSVVQKLEQNAIDSFVWWGSLLGSYRHHGPIPWHLDNDLLVDDKHREKVVQVLHKWRHDDFGSFLWKWHSGREGVNIKVCAPALQKQDRTRDRRVLYGPQFRVQGSIF